MQTWLRWARCATGVAAVLALAACALPLLRAVVRKMGGGRAMVALADPDTVWDGARWEYTYATEAPGRPGCDHRVRTFHVPVLRRPARRGRGDLITGACIVADALPDAELGSAAWGPVWSPSVVRHGDRYLMLFTARRPESGTGVHDGQRCVYRAWSSAPLGPFTGVAPVVCPAGGRWALDPHAFEAPGGDLYAVYRDDGPTGRGPSGRDQTSITGVRLFADGSADWPTARTLLRSLGDVGWDTVGATPGPAIVENPAMMPWADGHFYLWFSGNNWDAGRYSVGLADCGTTPLPDCGCSPLGGPDRPYFGWSRSGLGPQNLLPGDHPGPGGFSPYRSVDGWRAVWHWCGVRRFLSSGQLRRIDGTFVVQ